jgi:hypothetical protein
MGIFTIMATDPEGARLYLRDMLAAAGVGMNAASKAIGKNDAYIQQYISRGKPRWLSEPDREALVRSVPLLDAERLRPPPTRPLAPHRRDKAQIYPEGLGKFVNDPGRLELLRLYDDMPTDRQALALDIMRRLAAASLLMTG